MSNNFFDAAFHYSCIKQRRKKPGIKNAVLNHSQVATCYYIWVFTTSGVKSGLPVVRLDTIQM